MRMDKRYLQIKKELFNVYIRFFDENFPQETNEFLITVPSKTTSFRNEESELSQFLNFLQKNVSDYKLIDFINPDYTLIDNDFIKNKITKFLQNPLLSNVKWMGISG